MNFVFSIKKNNKNSDKKFLIAFCEDIFQKYGYAIFWALTQAGTKIFRHEGHILQLETRKDLKSERNI